MRRRRRAAFLAGFAAVFSALILGGIWAQDEPAPASDYGTVALSESPGVKPGKRTGIRCVLHAQPETTASARPAILVTYSDDGITWTAHNPDGAWSLSGDAAKSGDLRLAWNGSWWERYALVFSIQRFGAAHARGSISSFDSALGLPQNRVFSHMNMHSQALSSRT